MSTNGWNQKSQLELVHADTLENSTKYANAAKLTGNVHFKNQSINLFCDSAFFHQIDNWVRAYGRVQINQGDTLNLYADSLFFNGKTNIGKLQSNVKVRDNLFKLKTDSLHFNANTSVAYYTNHAFIKSNTTGLTLTSKRGLYRTNTKTFIFKDSVILNHPDYIVHSDTLEFKAIEEDILLHGPSTIWLDSTKITTKKGIYHTKTDDIQMWKKATVYSGNQVLQGDSLLFNNESQKATGYGNISIIDTLEKVNMFADYLQKEDSIVKLIGTAQIFQFQNKDTLAIQADTIIQKSFQKNDKSIQIAKSNVIIEQGELIGSCQLLYYSEKDSIIKLQKSPIIWRLNTEMTADSISIHTDKKTVKSMYLYQNAFVSIEHDSIHFDQCSGKFITVLLDSNKISEIFINNNAETIYFPNEASNDTITNEEIKILKGINYMLSNNITLYFQNGEVNKISFKQQPDASFKPIKNAKKEDLFLKKFKSQKSKKPSSISKIKLL